MAFRRTWNFDPMRGRMFDSDDDDDDEDLVITGERRIPESEKATVRHLAVQQRPSEGVKAALKRHSQHSGLKNDAHVEKKIKIEDQCEERQATNGAALAPSHQTKPLAPASSSAASSVNKARPPFMEEDSDTDQDGSTSPRPPPPPPPTKLSLQDLHSASTQHEAETASGEAAKLESSRLRQKSLHKKETQSNASEDGKVDTRRPSDIKRNDVAKRADVIEHARNLAAPRPSVGNATFPGNKDVANQLRQNNAPAQLQQPPNATQNWKNSAVLCTSLGNASVPATKQAPNERRTSTWLPPSAVAKTIDESKTLTASNILHKHAFLAVPKHPAKESPTNSFNRTTNSSPATVVQNEAQKRQIEAKDVRAANIRLADKLARKDEERLIHAKGPPNPVHTSPTVSKQEEARQQRIKAKEAQNVRNHAAEKIAREEEKELMQAKRPPSPISTSTVASKQEEARQQRIKEKEAQNTRNRLAEKVARDEEEKLVEEARSSPVFPTAIAKPGANEIHMKDGVKHLRAPEAQIRSDQSNALTLPQLPGDRSPQTESIAPQLQMEPDPRKDSGAEQLPNGPISLNSFAGQKLIAESGFRQLASRIGEISSEDIQLVKWRDSGIVWSKISETLPHRYGHGRKPDKLRARYNDLKRLLQSVSTSQELVDRAYGGDEEARREINRAIHGEWPVPGRSGQAQLETSRPPIATSESLLPNPARQQGGKIQPQDIDIVRWKDGGKSYATIQELLENKYGISRVIRTLSDKYRQVQSTLKRINADTVLREAVMSGDPEATARTINTRMELKVGGGRLQDVEDDATDTATVAAAGDRRDSVQPSSLSFASTCDSRALSEVTPRNPSLGDSNKCGQREEFGGKTIDAKAYMYFLEQHVEMHNQEDEEEGVSDGEDDEYEICDVNDTCHFAFRVQRRQITNDSMNDDAVIDEAPWTDCGEAFDNLADANRAASEYLYHTPRGESCIVQSAEDEFTLTHQSHDGHKHWTLENEDRGIVEVRVQSFVRTFERGRIPDSAGHWPKRKVYVVLKEKRQKEQEDELFGEASPAARVENVDNLVYTVLDMANQRAAEAFVEMTLRTNTARMNTVFAERQAATTKLLETMDEDELFDHTRDRADARIRVWVEERQIEGPRNIF